METCLITGASGGIGAEIARAFVGGGVKKIVLQYFSGEERAARLKAELERMGAAVLCVRADVSRESDIIKLSKLAEKSFGFVDAVVACAGVSLIKQINDTTESDFDQIVGVNLKGAYFTDKVFSRRMISEKRGRIINISSMWGVVGASCETAYSAAKGGVVTLTKALAKELAPSGITVNCICPGVIDTPMNAALSAETIETLKEETPLQRLGAPDDVAAAALFFADEKSSFITGQILTVDGGLTL